MVLDFSCEVVGVDHDHPAIREAVNGLHTMELDSKCSVANTQGPA